MAMDEAAAGKKKDPVPDPEGSKVLTQRLPCSSFLSSILESLR